MCCIVLSHCDCTGDSLVNCQISIIKCVMFDFKKLVFIDSSRDVVNKIPVLCVMFCVIFWCVVCRLVLCVVPL